MGLSGIKLNFIKGSTTTETLWDNSKTKGLLGSFILGALFLSVMFSFGTGLSVIFFAFIIALDMEKIGNYFKIITKEKKVMRIKAGLVFTSQARIISLFI